MSAPAPAAAVPDDAPHVLVVDDDRRIRDLLRRYLVGQGYRVTAASDAADARAKLDALVFDALILDVMMPGESGFDLARSLRGRIEAPILMLTARADGADRVTGLEIGAQDYLAKPFEPRELLLRLANVLRRAAPAAPAPSEAVRFGPYAYLAERGELTKGGERIRLTERERDILGILARANGAVVPRDALGVAGEGAAERTVDVQVNRLRRRIEDDPADPRYLQTVRGQGYRLLVGP